MLNYDQKQLSEASQLLNLPREDLLRKLSEDSDAGFVSDLVKEGRAIYRRTVDARREDICKNKKVQEAFSDTSANRRLLIVCAIADALGGHGFFTIAALVVQDGVELTCASYWKSKKNER